MSVPPTSLPTVAAAAPFALKLGGIFGILTASAAGVFVAMYFFRTQDSAKTPIFRAAKMLGAGLLLGVALMHLFVDGALNFNSESIEAEIKGYPIVFAVFLFGIVFMMGLQLLLRIALAETLPETHAFGVKVSDPYDGQMQDKIAAGLSLNKVLCFEASIVLHSVLIGFGLGVIGGEDASAVLALLIALLFHQFFEGISIGMIFREAELVQNLQLSAGVKYALLALFVVSTPIGIVIGIRTEETPDGAMIGSVFNCFAAGLLVYGCLVEVVSPEMAYEPVNKTEMLVKAQGYGAFVLGCACMAVLAIWA